MERRVDFPQPEGPAMETYSPVRMSRWMPERAWVSTSSVRKTLVTPSRWMRVWFPLFIVVLCLCRGDGEFVRRAESYGLVQADAIVGVVGAGIGEDDLIAFFQALNDFDGVD